MRIDEAWGLLSQARESSRMNPRRSQPAGLEELSRTLHLLEQAVADTLSMARTLAASAEHATDVGDDSRDLVAAPARGTAESVNHDDGDRLLQAGPARPSRRQALHRPSCRSAWLEYGGLLVNLRNVVKALTEVTGTSTRSPISARRSKRSEVPEKIPRVGRNVRSG